MRLSPSFGLICLALQFGQFLFSELHSASLNPASNLSPHTVPRCECWLQRAQIFCSTSISKPSRGLSSFASWRANLLVYVTYVMQSYQLNLLLNPNISFFFLFKYRNVARIDLHISKNNIFFSSSMIRSGLYSNKQFCPT